MTNNSLREEFEREFCNNHGGVLRWLRGRFNDEQDKIEKLFSWFESELSKARQQAEKEIAQECYLQCLAAECGEGECAEAIYTKFPKLISRFDPQ